MYFGIHIYLVRSLLVWNMNTSDSISVHVSLGMYVSVGIYKIVSSVSVYSPLLYQRQGKDNSKEYLGQSGHAQCSACIHTRDCSRSRTDTGTG